MYNLKQDLLSIGLTEEEITIYLATLQPDNDTILKLSKHTSIPRTTVYLLIETLIQKGLVYDEPDGKKKRYIPASPEKILRYVVTKRDQFTQVITDLQKNIPAIQALYNYRYEKPKLGYHEGPAEIKRLLAGTIGDDEICMHVMSEISSDILSEVIEHYRNNLRNKMVPSREIVSDSLTDKHYLKTEGTPRNQVRCLSVQYRTNVDYILHTEGIIFITYKNDIPMAIHIRDKNMVQFEKIRFNFLWDHPLLQPDNR